MPLGLLFWFVFLEGWNKSRQNVSLLIPVFCAGRYDKYFDIEVVKHFVLDGVFMRGAVPLIFVGGMGLIRAADKECLVLLN